MVVSNKNTFTFIRNGARVNNSVAQGTVHNNAAPPRAKRRGDIGRALRDPIAADRVRVPAAY